MGLHRITSEEYKELLGSQVVCPDQARTIGRFIRYAAESMDVEIEIEQDPNNPRWLRFMQEITIDEASSEDKT